MMITEIGFDCEDAICDLRDIELLAQINPDANKVFVDILEEINAVKSRFFVAMQEQRKGLEQGDSIEG